MLVSDVFFKNSNMDCPQNRLILHFKVSVSSTSWNFHFDINCRIKKHQCTRETKFCPKTDITEYCCSYIIII